MRQCKKIIISTVIALSILSACTKQDMGAGIGTVGGALMGSAFGKGNGKMAMAAVGGIFGAVAGSAIGKSLDDADKKYYNTSSNQTFESYKTGSTSTWKNPDSGNYGSTTIVKTYQQQNGNYCREFTQKINVGGKESEGYGTACRQPDGSWKITQQD